jgi:hypothetical protein
VGGWVGFIIELLFKNKNKNSVMKDLNFFNDKLIGDVAYPMHPRFYYPFKGEKGELPRYKAHRNFIRLNTKMSMEKTF